MTLDRGPQAGKTGAAIAESGPARRGCRAVPWTGRIQQGQEGHLCPRPGELLRGLKGHEAPEGKTAEKIRALGLHRAYFVEVVSRYGLHPNIAGAGAVLALVF